MKTISRSKVQRKKDSAGWMTIYCTGALVVVFLLWWCLHQYVSSTILNSVKESKSLFRAIATIKKQSESISDSISESKLIENIRYQENRLANIFKSGNNDLRIEPPRIKHHSDKLKVAFAITMTKDGSFQDGAAVLAYSIYNSKMTFDCDVSLVAFVHPNVSTSRSVLSKLGYHVIEVPTPVNTTAIRFTFLREKIDRNGCCGAAELIKLNSYRLTQYDVVVHMDADTYFLNVSNPTFLLLASKFSKSIEELFVLNASLIYTTDPNMATFRAPEKMPVQGGFLVIRPNVTDYEILIHTLMNTDFVLHQGWNRSQIGWFWGGMTVQGILPYYYVRITHPGRTLVLDRCIYNSMADTPACAARPLSDLKSAHFTVCQKPWVCQKVHENTLCRALHEDWFRLREAAESFYGLQPINRPCPGGGSKHYVPMDLGNAQIQWHIDGHFIPDESPDILLPIGDSGYNIYH